MLIVLCRRMVLPAVLVALLGASLLAAGAASPGWARLGLAITLSPANGAPGDSVTVTGTGYDGCPDYGSRKVNVLWDGQDTGASAPIGADGRFSAVFTVPASATVGQHLVYGQCQDGGEWARATFEVAALSTGGQANLTVTVSPGRGRPGQSVTVTGTGYDGCPNYGNHAVDVLWDGQGTGTTVPIRADGRFSARLTIPAAAGVGDHLVYGRCQDGGEWARTTFAVTAAPAPTAVTRSPSAGTPTGPTPTGSASADATPTTSTGPTNTPSGAAPTPSAQGQPAPGDPPGGWPRPPFVDAIPGIGELSYAPLTLALLFVVIAVLAWIAIGWPAELFNKTYEENEATIRRWLRLPPTPRPATASSWPVVALFAALAAAMVTFGQPGDFDPKAATVMLLGLLIAIPIVVISYEFAIESYHRVTGAGAAARLRVVFPALGVALVCVVASRLLHFVPGYVYGLIIAYTIGVERERDPRRDAVAVLRGAAVLFGLAAGAWLLWQFGTAQAAAGDETPFGLRLLDTVLGLITVLSLETLVIGLMPLRFLHGNTLWRWRRAVWFPVYLLGATAFVLLLIGPKADEEPPADIARALWLFIAFFFGSVGFWALFALRRHRTAVAASRPAGD